MVNIRPAQLQDIDTIYNLGISAPEFLVNENTVNFWPRDILSGAVNSDDTIVLVAELDKQVVGFIIANLSVSLRKAIIENIYVNVESRSQGIGDMLISSFLDMLGGTTVEYVIALVPLDAGQATKLYESAGFEKGETFLWLDKSISETFESHKN